MIRNVFDGVSARYLMIDKGYLMILIRMGILSCLDGYLMVEKGYLMIRMGIFCMSMGEFDD
jgi:hypothetical protein